MFAELALSPFQITVLAFIQGATEFLPISSSAHLILPSVLLGWEDQGLTFDVAVHLGSLLAVLTYFRVEIVRLVRSWLVSLLSRGNVGEQDRRSAKLAWLLILATIPAGLAGLLLESYVEQYARSARVIAAASILFGLLLYRADTRAASDACSVSQLEAIDWRQALWVGLAQVLALIPGTSRSGITMTAALYCGLNRDSASRLSFLMAIPIILASGLLRTGELLGRGVDLSDVALLTYATLFSALVAYSCIHYFLRFIAQIGFLPFVIYRVLLGCVLLVFFW